MITDLHTFSLRFLFYKERKSLHRVCAFSLPLELWKQLTDCRDKSCHSRSS